MCVCVKDSMWRRVLAGCQREGGMGGDGGVLVEVGGGGWGLGSASQRKAKHAEKDVCREKMRSKIRSGQHRRTSTHTLPSIGNVCPRHIPTGCPATGVRGCPYQACEVRPTVASTA